MHVVIETPIKQQCANVMQVHVVEPWTNDKASDIQNLSDRERERERDLICSFDCNFVGKRALFFSLKFEDLCNTQVYCIILRINFFFINFLSFGVLLF